MKIIKQTSDKINILTPAKLNLTLEILSKRSDGYHNLRSVVSTLDIFDEVEIRIRKRNPKDKIITLVCDNPKVPVNHKNTAYQAAKLILESFNSLEKGKKIQIKIKKKIPIAGGLGGSSTDAAAVLVGMNKLLKLKLSLSQLRKLGLSIGSDLDIFLVDGVISLKKVGELDQQIKRDGLKAPILLLTTFKQWDTTKAYSKYKISLKANQRVNISKKMKEAVIKNSINEITKYLFNDFESAESSDKRYILRVKNLLKSTGALGSLLSGSGSSIYGIYPDNYTLTRAKKSLTRIIAKDQKILIFPS